MSRKHLFFSTALVLSLIAVERIYNFRTGGFRSSKVLSHLPDQREAPPPEITPLLDQTFHFLGKGGTSYVFLGQDDKTVLKLFKHHHLYFKSLWQRIVLPGVADGARMRKIVALQKKQEHKLASFFFNSCEIAMQMLPEETGLIYFCKNPNSHFQQKLKVFDACGVSHTVDLSRAEFSLQKKADLLFPVLKKLLVEGRNEDVRQRIDALIELIQRRCRKGIGDRDPNLKINFGYIGTKAVEFDLGSYFPKPELKSPFAETHELFFATQDLQTWLKEHSPEHLHYLMQRIVSMGRGEEREKSDQSL